MIPDISGMIASWLIARGYYKKGSKDLADAVKIITSAIEKITSEVKETLHKILPEAIEKAVKTTLEPILQKANLEQQPQVNNDIKALSTELSYIATGAIIIEGAAGTGYTPFGPPMTKSVIEEEKRSFSDGLEDFYKNK